LEKEGENMKLLPPSGWKEVKGIFVYGCIKRGEGSMFRASAHAHNKKSDPYFGWICFRGLRKVGKVFLEPIKQFRSSDCQSTIIWDGAVLVPSKLLYHEYAHILAPNCGHTDKWREKMKELGQSTYGYGKKKGRKRRERRSNWP
jgi:hypothetical protein